MADNDALTRANNRDEATPASDDDERSAQHAAIPAVDIFEDAAGITLLADMPGVSRQRLEVRLDGDTLAIEGSVELPAQAAMSALWAEVNVPRLRRKFTLSRELDSAHIEANMKDGVLSLRIPKLAEAQARRITVQVD
jgi:HSP20 family protein